LFTLGLETSTNAASIALYQNDACLDERQLSTTGVRHAQSLVFELEQMVELHHLNLSDCQNVAVSIGPGSFTGLRIGVVCAKTLAFITGCQLTPIDTLLTVAENCPREFERVFAIADAQRGDLYVGEYLRGMDGNLKRIGEIEIFNGPEWTAHRSPEDLICGPGLKRFGSQLEGKCQLAPSELWTPQASTVARLASQFSPFTKFEELSALEPFYLRKSAAEENWEKKQTG